MKRFVASALAVVAFAAMPAHAQLSPGVSGFSSAPTSASEAEYWIMIRKLGLCLADSKRDQSEAFLATEPGSPEEGKAFDEIFHRFRNRCMGNFVRASMVRGHVRGSIAEGMIDMMPEGQLERAFFTPPSAPELVTSLHDFAECYVAAKPRVAQQFLAETKVGTKGELEAVRQMSVDFGPCLPSGVEIRISPVDVRMAIAEAIYQVAHQASSVNYEGDS